MKTAEMMKFGKGFYVTTKNYGRTMGREWFKTKTAANTRIKELKKEGYEIV